jgi:hypothetical protein
MGGITGLRVYPDPLLFDVLMDFAVDQADAILSKDGQDLVFTFNDGEVLTLHSFYDNFGISFPAEEKTN